VSTLNQRLAAKAIATDGSSMSSSFGGAVHSPSGKASGGKTPQKREDISKRKIAAG
jgi:hypothetical protein